MNHKIIPSLLIILVAVTACNLPSTPLPPTATVTVPSVSTPLPVTPTIHISPTATNTPISPTPTNSIPPEPSTTASWTLDMLKNGTYYAPSYKRTVTLVNGQYSEGSGGNSYSVRMMEVYALGDLNGDGKADAAVLLAENGGGSGVFISLIAVLNQGGAPHQQSQAELGDRVLVNSADISSGVIHLDMVVPGPNDPSCCPAQPQKQNYWLIDNRLWLMRVTSTIGGTEHIINVDSPAIWSTVINPFTVKGSVTVLPFENTLAYHLYLTDGTEVNASPQSVTPSTGTAGTFSRTVNLSNAGITDWVIIQLVDVSAADGSTIALGSVILKAK